MTTHMLKEYGVAVLRLMRPSQWVKNSFVLLPLVFGGKLFVYPANVKTLLASIIFSFAASAGYILNDIIDYRKDKEHPVKKARPIASGKVSTSAAWGLAAALAVVALWSSFLIGQDFGNLILVYLVFNVLYSKILKNVVLVDVFCIGFFFFLRISAGGMVSEVWLSHWILFMTILLSLFLGFTKRRQEIKTLEGGGSSHREVLAKYSPYFIDQMVAVITSSIVLAYMLYTIDAGTMETFGNDHMIYSIPFVYFGVFRYLYLIHRFSSDGDPTRMLLRDWILGATIVAWLCVCVGVVYFGW